MSANRVETTYRAQIFMAGDIGQAKQVCREYCKKVGLCVTVTPTDFIYTGGEEAGFVIGLINYPRFPATPEIIEEHAVALANVLRVRLCQHSFSIVTDVNTYWFSERDA